MESIPDLGGADPRPRWTAGRDRRPPMRSKPITSLRYELLRGGREVALFFDGVVGLDHPPASSLPRRPEG